VTRVPLLALHDTDPDEGARYHQLRSDLLTYLQRGRQPNLLAAAAVLFPERLASITNGEVAWDEAAAARFAEDLAARCIKAGVNHLLTHPSESFAHINAELDAIEERSLDLAKLKMDLQAAQDELARFTKPITTYEDYQPDDFLSTSLPPLRLASAPMPSRFPGSVPPTSPPLTVPLSIEQTIALPVETTGGETPEVVTIKLPPKTAPTGDLTKRKSKTWTHRRVMQLRDEFKREFGPECVSQRRFVDWLDDNEYDRRAGFEDVPSFSTVRDLSADWGGWSLWWNAPPPGETK
jgi:hypothetical protein